MDKTDEKRVERVQAFAVALGHGEWTDALFTAYHDGKAVSYERAKAALIADLIAVSVRRPAPAEDRGEVVVAKPVAWRFRQKGMTLWSHMESKPPFGVDGLLPHEWECEPLYAAPQSRNDLIEGTGDPIYGGQMLSRFPVLAQRLRAIHSERAKPTTELLEAAQALDGSFHALVALLSALPSPPKVEVTEATHRHVKRGIKYVLIGYGKMQAQRWYEPSAAPRVIYSRVDMREVAIYRSVDDDGSLWVRPREEFEDGRFAALAFLNKEAGK